MIDILDFENHSLVQFYHRNLGYLIFIVALMLGYIIYIKKKIFDFKTILLCFIFF